MKTMLTLTKRNIKLFFSDKGMFLPTLITPAILLVLYMAFLADVFRDSISANIGSGLVSEGIIDGLVGGQIISSMLAVSCVTVSFCANLIMIQDKANGSIKDLSIAPLKPHIMPLSYYFASFTASLIVCLCAAGLCFIYIAVVGWYLTAIDVVLLLVDVILLVMFGTALSSIVHFFLSTQGQMSAVGTLVSAGYGFFCGAYMPMSSFGEGLRNALTFFPGTYGTVLVRNHAMGSAIEKMAEDGVPAEAINSLKDAFDCNLYFFEDKVSMPVMYGVICGTIVVLLGVYVLLNYIRTKKPNFGVAKSKPAKAKKEKKNA